MEKITVYYTGTFVCDFITNIGSAIRKHKLKRTINKYDLICFFDKVSK